MNMFLIWQLLLEEQKTRITNLIDDFLNGLKQIMNKEEEFIASRLDGIEKLRMDLRFLRTFVLFGNSTNLNGFYFRMSTHKFKFNVRTQFLFHRDELIL